MGQLLRNWYYLALGTCELVQLKCVHFKAFGVACVCQNVCDYYWLQCAKYCCVVIPYLAVVVCVCMCVHLVCVSLRQ